MTCSCDIKKPTDKPSKCTVTVCYDSLARDKGSAWEEEDCRLSQALPGPITLQALSNAKNPLRRKQQNSFLHIGLSFPPSFSLSLSLLQGRPREVLTFGCRCSRTGCSRPAAVWCAQCAPRTSGSSDKHTRPQTLVSDQLKKGSTWNKSAEMLIKMANWSSPLCDAGVGRYILSSCHLPSPPGEILHKTEDRIKIYTEIWLNVALILK